MKLLSHLPELQPLANEANDKLSAIADYLIAEYGLGEDEDKKEILAYLARAFSKHLYRVSYKGRGA